MKKLLAGLAVAMMVLSLFVIIGTPDEDQSYLEWVESKHLSDSTHVDDGINILEFNSETGVGEAIIINDAEGLKRLSKIVNGSDELQSDFAGYTIYLTKDIKLEDNWIPIGAYTESEENRKPFNGLFDGQGHTISNLKISGNVRSAGLFGHVGSEGIVRNLGLIDTTISIDSSTNADAGCVVGYNSGTIANCYNTGNVDARSASSNAPAFAGGIAGYNNNGTIVDCYNTGNMDAFASGAFASASNSHAAGIAGYTYGGTITNCYNTGTISAYTHANTHSQHLIF